MDNKTFFDQPVKNKQKAYEKLTEMSRNDDCATGNLLDYLDHKKYYELIGIDLSRQTNNYYERPFSNTSILQQIHFIEN